MSWPKHSYGWIVLGGFGGPMRDNGQGSFCESGFAEVFLDRKAAEWVAGHERKSFKRLAELYQPESGIVTAKEWIRRHEWMERYRAVRIIRIALPGTYAQFQVPDRLEREWRRTARVVDLKKKTDSRLGRRREASG
jgi:hypothetical protein